MTDDADQTLFIDGANCAVAGYFQRCGQPPVIVYDYVKLVEWFCDKNETTYEEAVEWVDYNVTGSWCGQGTPAVMFFGDAASVFDVLGYEATG